MRLRLTFTEVAVILMIGLLLLQFALTEYSRYAGRRDGAADAVSDIKSSTLKLQIGGKPQPWTPIYIGMCKERYGIDIERRYACTPTDYQSSYLSAYNEVMLRHISESLDEGFSVSDLISEAHDQWATSHSVADN
jgi:hypothetical protein